MPIWRTLWMRCAMADPLAEIKAALSAKAEGYAAVIDGVLNVRTVADTRNGAAVNAAYICGYRVLQTCADPACDCLVRLLQSVRPDIRVVNVTVGVRDG